MSDEDLLIKPPGWETCDHGVEFDEEEASKMIASNPYDKSIKDPALAFVMGSPASAQIRKRWPRLNGVCPKGCGYVGIAYASHAHYIMGDW